MNQRTHVLLGVVIGVAAVTLVSAMRAPVSQLSDAVASTLHRGLGAREVWPNLAVEALPSGAVATVLNIVGALLTGALVFSSGPLGCVALLWARLGRPTIRPSSAIHRALHGLLV